MTLLSDLQAEVQAATVKNIDPQLKVKFLLLIAIAGRMRDRLALLSDKVMTYDPNATPEWSHADYVRMPTADWEALSAAAQASLDEVA